MREYFPFTSISAFINIFPLSIDKKTYQNIFIKLLQITDIETTTILTTAITAVETAVMAAVAIVMETIVITIKIETIRKDTIAVEVEEEQAAVVVVTKIAIIKVIHNRTNKEEVASEVVEAVLPVIGINDYLYTKGSLKQTI